MYYQEPTDNGALFLMLVLLGYWLAQTLYTMYQEKKTRERIKKTGEFHQSPAALRFRNK